MIIPHLSHWFACCNTLAKRKYEQLRNYRHVFWEDLCCFRVDFRAWRWSWVLLCSSSVNPFDLYEILVFICLSNIFMCWQVVFQLHVIFPLNLLIIIYRLRGVSRFANVHHHGLCRFCTVRYTCYRICFWTFYFGLKGMITAWSVGSYGNNTLVICCPAPGHPKSAVVGTSPPDNKSRGCCHHSRPTAVNPDYNMTKQLRIKCIYEKICSNSPPNWAMSLICLYCDVMHLSLMTGAAFAKLYEFINTGHWQQFGWCSVYLYTKNFASTSAIK